MNQRRAQKTPGQYNDYHGTYIRWELRTRCARVREFFNYISNLKLLSIRIKTALNKSITYSTARTANVRTVFWATILYKYHACNVSKFDNILVESAGPDCLNSNALIKSKHRNWYKAQRFLKEKTFLRQVWMPNKKYVVTTLILRVGFFSRVLYVAYFLYFY